MEILRKGNRQCVTLLPLHWPSANWLLKTPKIKKRANYYFIVNPLILTLVLMIWLLLNLWDD